MTWVTIHDHPGCSAENGLRPRVEAGRGMEGLLQAKGGADDGGGNEGRETRLNSGYSDLIGLDIGVWEREQFRGLSVRMAVLSGQRSDWLGEEQVWGQK